jgi:hypothetical protein
MKGLIGAVFAGMVLLAACEEQDPTEAIAAAQPAAGASLEEHSLNISRSVQLAGDADLVQRFCRNTSGEACPPDIADKLKSFGFVDNQTGVDLAYAFVLMAADAKDGKSDLSSSDEDFLAAAYRVALGRVPDEGGAQSNLAFIRQNGERKAMLRSLLESQEFKSQ